MKTLKDRDRIKVWHRPKERYLFGTLVTLRGCYRDSEFLRDKWPTYEKYAEDQLRRQASPEVWGRQDPIIITSDPKKRQKLEALRAACVEIKDGEVIVVDGRQWTARIVGDFSDFVHFHPVEANAENLEKACA